MTYDEELVEIRQRIERQRAEGRKIAEKLLAGLPVAYDPAIFRRKMRQTYVAFSVFVAFLAYVAFKVLT